MIVIESLINYCNTLNNEDFSRLINQIYQMSSPMSQDYKDYHEWFYQKQIPGIFNGTRNILFVRNKDDIIAISCLKKTEEERKICSLYVSSEYRNNGIGTSLIEESMRWLDTSKPFITMADSKLDMFLPFVKKYDWKLTEVVNGLYSSDSNELCFNGSLTKNITKTFNNNKSHQ